MSGGHQCRPEPAPLTHGDYAAGRPVYRGAEVREELSYDQLMDSFAQKNNLLESLLKSLEDAVSPHLLPLAAPPLSDNFAPDSGAHSIMAHNINVRLKEYGRLLSDLSLLINRIQR